MANNNNKYKIKIPYSELKKYSAEVIISKLYQFLNDGDIRHRKFVKSFTKSQHFKFFLRTTDFCKFVKIANFLDDVEDAR